LALPAAAFCLGTPAFFTGVLLALGFLVLLEVLVLGFLMRVAEKNPEIASIHGGMISRWSQEVASYLIEFCNFVWEVVSFTARRSAIIKLVRERHLDHVQETLTTAKSVCWPVAYIMDALLGNILPSFSERLRGMGVVCLLMVPEVPKWRISKLLVAVMMTV